MIQLTKHELICTSDLETLTRQFEERHILRLPQLLHPEVLRIASAGVERGSWFIRNHGKIARELCLDDPITLSTLLFVSNTPGFLELVKSITLSKRIICFDGRVYRMAAGHDHHDSWHNDVNGNRLVGMSINLGARPYTGGVFRLRKSNSEDILCELPNVVPGDAILFRISIDLAHMVTDVVGDEPKTAFAGWFTSAGSDLFRSLCASRQK